MLELTMLPARQGDAIWIRWGDEAAPRQLLIDLGTEAIGNAFRRRLEKLPEPQRRFELLVVTHVDQDHIGGVLTGIAEADPIAGFAIEDVWFNGWNHLTGGQVKTSMEDSVRQLEAFGPAQGERLAKFLRSYRWNHAFDGNPVIRTPRAAPPRVDLADGMTLTVIGPTQQRLTKFQPTWKEEVEIALAKGRLDEASPGLEAFGSAQPPVLESDDDLAALADRNTGDDDSPANGSSIALLLEYGGKRIMLAGDAFADDLVEGLEALDSDGPIAVDAFKLPHHGSQKNVSQRLIQSVRCRNWLISTDGTRFKHPDATAIARIIRHSRERDPALLFNVRSTYNGWWDKSDWKRCFGYSAKYGSQSDGLTLTF